MNEWEQEILKICKSQDIEVYPASSPSGKQGYIFYKAEPLSDYMQRKIRGIVPAEMEIAFKSQDKPSTIPTLTMVILTSGARAVPQFKAEGRHLDIDIQALPEEMVDRMRIDGILEHDGYFQTWTVKIDGQELYSMNLIGRRLSKEIQGNKKRAYALTNNDVTDLRITLETCKTVDEFLEAI